MKILRQSQLDEIAQALDDGAVVAVPTETVYGLAVKFDNPEAVDKLVAIKQRGRDSGKVFALMLSDVGQIGKYALLGDRARRTAERYLPGELTLVLPKNPEFVNSYYDDYQTVGIRVPKHKFMQDLLAKTGALIVTSANKKGLDPALDSDSLEQELPEVSVVVKGKSGNQPPTTVVDFTTDKPKILRRGNIIPHFSFYKDSPCKMLVK
jgi:L-threonylcarbamoyladenylate synthase